MAHALTPIRSAWGWFRDWRRSRPFWGGFLLVAAGVELLVAPAAQSLVLPIDLVIYAGIAGVYGPLIAFLLISLGVLSWLQPAQHVFFGLVGLMLALVSFPTSNFGGFVIGMLLGIVGGSLVFAWSPEVRRRPRRRRGARPPASEETGADTGKAEDTGPEDTGTGTDTDTDNGTAGTRDRTEGPGGDDTLTETVDRAEPRDHPRYLAAVALPLAAAVTIASAPAPTLGWPWDWLLPGDDKEQTEEQPSEEPSDEPTERPGGTDPEDDPAEDPADEDTETDEPEDGTDEEEEETDPEEGDAEDCELRVGEAALIEDEEDLLAAVLACQAAQDEGQYPEVLVDSDYDCFRGSVRDSGLTADSLTMYGARYRGVVECPTEDGPQRYIRLTMSSGDVRGGELWFDDLGTRRSLGLPTMNMTGDVEMHVTRMHVRLLGIPLTFTPDFPPPLLLPIMYLTDVDVDNPIAYTDTMTIPDLNGQYGG
ncbi:DUF6114 domain-containing protein [Nocardiopsis sp. L17-MgMaSL7]|uniref:DUF6114 domain-containing protein n=1 Tax=Nocardiopsis sp. L17-MgMaSL7 TaxID=1938893 RepID=UPI000D7094A3|nr:DUF6114 domain-containing protein [Nocardiopsis sp. L17-MgMaSL7]PWV58231.1 hypothetical protein BDW27_101471 [Nocardiopsis sp. L17-MgMaSL7]